MVMDSILLVQEDILICSAVVMVLDIGMDGIHDNKRISFVLTHHPVLFQSIWMAALNSYFIVPFSSEQSLADNPYQM
jgi:hypothetical protein